jgi:hypothetical protein
MVNLRAAVRAVAIVVVACASSVVLASPASAVAVSGDRGPAADVAAPGTVLVRTSRVIGSVNSEEFVAEQSISTPTGLSDVHTRAGMCPGPGGDGPPTVLCPGEVKCRTLLSRYRIYVWPFGPDLVTWDFNHEWCWEMGWAMVSLSDRDELRILSGLIVTSGSKSIRRENNSFSRRIVYEGLQFQVCFPHACIKSFNPKIDYVFRAKTYQNFSVI